MSFWEEGLMVQPAKVTLGSKMDGERKNAANIFDSIIWRLILLLMP